jgi:hypothetical protein
VRSKSAVRGVALFLAVSGLTGCNASQLQFKNDDRLTFESPKSRKLVTVPFTVSWSMQGFEATGLDGSKEKTKGIYAVFVDKAPMPVGKDLKWLARDDSGCKRDAQCPNAQFLADRNIFVTTETSVTLQTLPTQSEGVGDEQHFVNVVLLDGTGHRIGESAWYRPFTSKRRSTT